MSYQYWSLSLQLTDVENNNTVTLFCDELPDLPFTYVSVGRVVDVLQLSDVSVSRRGFTGSFRAVTNDILRYVPGNWSEVSWSVTGSKQIS